MFVCGVLRVVACSGHDNMRYLLQGVPKKRLPFEVKRQCRMFEFECLNSLMSPGMRKTLELGIFILTLRMNLRIFGLIGDLKHSNAIMRH